MQCMHMQTNMHKDKTAWMFLIFLNNFSKIIAKMTRKQNHLLHKNKTPMKKQKQINNIVIQNVSHHSHHVRNFSKFTLSQTT